MHNKTRAKVSLSLVTMLLLSMMAMFPIITVNASPTTYFSVINPNTGDSNFKYTNAAPPPSNPSYPLGYLLVNLTVTDVVLLKLWQFNITWDPTLLEIAAPADIYLPADHIFSFAIPGPLLKSIDNTKGTAFWGYGAGIGSVPDHFNGTGICCQIKFNVTRTPVEGETLSCNIHLVTTGFVLSKLVGPGGVSMPFTPQDGYYEYRWPPPPTEGAAFYVEPPEIINSSIIPPQTIQINVTVKNVTEMYGYEFHLSYDPNILICISLNMSDPLGETHYIPQFSVNNTLGVIIVNVTYYPPAVPITTELEVSLVNLRFRVVGMGATPLNLTGTNLVDSLNRQIPHAVHHGFFMNLIRDLAVTNVVPNAAFAYPGNPIKINVTVQNNGEIVETSITVKAYYDGNLIDTKSISSLNPSEETTITFDWNTATVTPCHNYTMSAEVVPVPSELDLGNNVFTDGKVKVRLVGDANGDGLVDGSDVVIVIEAIPSYPGHPFWNPEADMNGDNIVDGVDLVMTIEKVGTWCS